MWNSRFFVFCRVFVHLMCLNDLSFVFFNLKTNFSYQEFINEPELYNNCYIHWKGRLSNLIITESLITFDFLVGYDGKKILEGIIPVTLDFGARIDSDFPIEVLGKIKKTNNQYIIEAVSVHQYQ